MDNVTGRIRATEVRCPCSKSFQNAGVYLRHKETCGIFQTGNIMHPPSRPSKKSRAKKIKCPCGKTFVNLNALNQHVQDSSIHQAANFRPTCTTGTTTSSGNMTLTLPPSHPISTPPSSSLKPGTIPLSVLSPASLVHCTCGHSFENQRVLDLHKRDSLHHRREAGQPSRKKEEEESSLVSALESLRLDSVSTQPKPTAARFAYICDRTSTETRVLEKQKRGTKTFPLVAQAEGQKKVFTSPRPDYQKDEYLAKMADMLAKQNSST